MDVLPGRLCITPNVVRNLYPASSRRPAELSTARRVTAPARLGLQYLIDRPSLDGTTSLMEEQIGSGEDELSHHTSISGNLPLRRAPLRDLRIDIPPLPHQDVIVTTSDESAPTIQVSCDEEGKAPGMEFIFPRMYRLQQGTPGISWGAQQETCGRIISLKTFEKDHLNQRLKNDLGVALLRELKVYRRISSFTPGTRGKQFITKIEKSMQNTDLVCFSMVSFWA